MTDHNAGSGIDDDVQTVHHHGDISRAANPRTTDSPPPDYDSVSFAPPHYPNSHVDGSDLGSAIDDSGPPVHDLTAQYGRHRKHRRNTLTVPDGGLVRKLAMASAQRIANGEPLRHDDDNESIPSTSHNGPYIPGHNPPRGFHLPLQPIRELQIPDFSADYLATHPGADRLVLRRDHSTSHQLQYLCEPGTKPNGMTISAVSGRPLSDTRMHMVTGANGKSVLKEHVRGSPVIKARTPAQHVRLVAKEKAKWEAQCNEMKRDEEWAKQEAQLHQQDKATDDEQRSSGSERHHEDNMPQQTQIQRNTSHNTMSEPGIQSDEEIASSKAQSVGAMSPETFRSEMSKVASVVQRMTDRLDRRFNEPPSIMSPASSSPSPTQSVASIKSKSDLREAIRSISENSERASRESNSRSARSSSSTDWMVVKPSSSSSPSSRRSSFVVVDPSPIPTRQSSMHSQQHRWPFSDRSSVGEEDDPTPMPSPQSSKHSQRPQVPDRGSDRESEEKNLSEWYWDGQDYFRTGSIRSGRPQLVQQTHRSRASLAYTAHNESPLREVYSPHDEEVAQGETARFEVDAASSAPGVLRRQSTQQLRSQLVRSLGELSLTEASNSPPIHAGTGWISPHPLSEAPNVVAQHIRLPSGALMSYEEFDAMRCGMALGGEVDGKPAISR